MKQAGDSEVILITGAGGGLGGTAALALAERGAHVILLDKKIPALEKVYDAVVAAGGVEPVMYPFDLAGASENDYQELAATLEERYGALHGLLHSAVEFGAFTPLSLHPTAEWGHALNVNLNAPFLLTRVLLPVLAKSGRASVVFTSDSAARAVQAYSGAYGISKIALESLAVMLAKELETAGKIRVNVLVPGPVDSPLRRRAYPGEDKARLPAMTSLAPVYRFLFGADSRGITGQIIDARTFHL